MNTGEGTYLNSKGQHFSAIVCSPKLVPRFGWTVLNNHLFSDHLPISIDILQSSIKQVNRNAKWCLQRADWHLYRNSFPSIRLGNSVAESVPAAIIEAANKSITVSRECSSKRRVSWRNKEIKFRIQFKESIKYLSKISHSGEHGNFQTL